MTTQELINRAAELRAKTAPESITAELLGGLLQDMCEQLAAVEAQNVQLSTLDAMVATTQQAVAAMSDTTRYNVMNRNIKVGELSFLGDTMTHGVTQVFTTNLTLMGDGTFGDDHTHGDVFTYHRTWVIRIAGNLTEVGKWSAWAVATGNTESVTTITTEE